MQFAKLPQVQYQKRSSVIAEDIVQRIRRNELSAGVKLPSERLIAEQLGVSRPSVREAISALQIVVVLESRPGDGTYVCERIGFEDLSREAVRVLEKNDSPLELLQARKALEIGAVRMVIQVAAPKDVERIRRACRQKHEAGVRRNYDGYLARAYEFHMAVARATGNSLIERMTEDLMQATQQPLWLNMRRTYYAADDRRIMEMLDVHDRIVAAIVDRDTEQAILAIEAHFDILIQRTYNLSDLSLEPGTVQPSVA
jgi:GntR family transcriptional repressor for pyruvate dehydrogenase complex